jgi:hypothetical protein
MKKIISTILLCAAATCQQSFAQPQQTGIPQYQNFPQNVPQLQMPQFANPQAALPQGQNMQPQTPPPPDPEKFAALFPEINGATDKIGLTFWEKSRYWFLSAAILAAIIAGFCFRRRKVPEIPPIERAISRINLAKDDAENLDAKVFARNVSQAVRDYIEDVHNLPAPERTTQEFLRIAALAPNFDETEHGQLEKILTLADMAKFAKHSFKKDEKVELAQTALEFVDYDNKKIEESKNNPPPPQNDGASAEQKKEVAADEL